MVTCDHVIRAASRSVDDDCEFSVFERIILELGFRGPPIRDRWIKLCFAHKCYFLFYYFVILVIFIKMSRLFVNYQQPLSPASQSSSPHREQKKLTLALYYWERELFSPLWWGVSQSDEGVISHHTCHSEALAEESTKHHTYGFLTFVRNDELTQKIKKPFLEKGRVWDGFVNKLFHCSHKHRHHISSQLFHIWIRICNYSVII